MEVGHAGQNVMLQATALGLGCVGIGAFDDDFVKDFLGSKEEAPLYIIPIGKPAK
jgi:nitroreductase